MRAKQSFSNQIINAKKKDQVIKIKYQGKDYPVRVMISDYVEDVLLTSIV